MSEARHPPRRLLALDPGDIRTGVAVSDELGLFAHPRPALAGSGETALAAIARMVREEGICEVVVGLPLRLNGTDSAQTVSARAFALVVRSRTGLPVTVWDERLSSVQAGRSVHGPERRKSGELDSAAAALVLQAVLDRRAGGVSR